MTPEEFVCFYKGWRKMLFTSNLVLTGKEVKPQQQLNFNMRVEPDAPSPEKGPTDPGCLVAVKNRAVYKGMLSPVRCRAVSHHCAGIPAGAGEVTYLHPFGWLQHAERGISSPRAASIKVDLPAPSRSQQWADAEPGTRLS